MRPRTNAEFHMIAFVAGSIVGISCFGFATLVAYLMRQLLVLFHLLPS